MYHVCPVVYFAFNFMCSVIVFKETWRIRRVRHKFDLTIDIGILIKL